MILPKEGEPTKQEIKRKSYCWYNRDQIWTIHSTEDCYLDLDTNQDITKEEDQDEEVLQGMPLQYSIKNNINTNNSNIRKLDSQMKDAIDGHKCVLFPTFDLSTKRIGFENRSSRISTVAYDIGFHPANSNLLKSFLIKSLVLNPISLSGSNIHFIPPPPPPVWSSFQTPPL